jgi:hypothetical protein
MSGIEISKGAGLCSMMKCGVEATQHIRVRHARDESESYLWACPAHFPQVEQFARNIVNGPGLEFFVQLAPRSFKIVVLETDSAPAEDRTAGETQGK